MKVHPSLYTKGGQQGELMEPHIRMQLGQERRIIKIRHILLFVGFLFQLIQLRKVSSSLLRVNLVSVQDLSKRCSRSAFRVCQPQIFTGNVLEPRCGHPSLPCRMAGCGNKGP